MIWLELIFLQSYHRLGRPLTTDTAVSLGWSPRLRRYARCRLAALLFLELASIGRPKLLTPLANCFVGEVDAAFAEQFFSRAKTEAEPMLEPHGGTDSLGRKTMALVAGLFGVHHASLPKAG